MFWFWYRLHATQVMSLWDVRTYIFARKLWVGTIDHQAEKIMCVRSLQIGLNNDLFVATYMVTVMKYCDSERKMYCWILLPDDQA